MARRGGFLRKQERAGNRCGAA